MAMSAAKTANKTPKQKAAKKTARKKAAAVEAPVAARTVAATLGADESSEYDYVIKHTSNSAKPVEVAPDDAVAEAASTRAVRDWYSGYCSTPKKDMPCPDGRDRNKAGEIIRRCLYIGVNGEKVKPRHLFCACACHRDIERAGQALAIPTGD